LLGADIRQYIELFFSLYWNNLGFRTLLNRSVDYLTKKLLDYPNQRFVIGREDNLEMIAKSRADNVDW